jgi:hypothetical protein
VLACCTTLSSTAAHGRSASIRPPASRIDRSTTTVRRTLVRCLPHRPTNQVRFSFRSPIIFSGARPLWRQRAWDIAIFGPAAGCFSAADYRLQSLTPQRRLRLTRHQISIDDGTLLKTVR